MTAFDVVFDVQLISRGPHQTGFAGQLPHGKALFGRPPDHICLASPATPSRQYSHAHPQSPFPPKARRSFSVGGWGRCPAGGADGARGRWIPNTTSPAANTKTTSPSPMFGPSSLYGLTSPAMGEKIYWNNSSLEKAHVTRRPASYCAGLSCCSAGMLQCNDPCEVCF